MSRHFVYNLLLLLGAAALVYLVIVALVYSGNRRHTKRYRPGRPFEFEPVWFLSQPERQARSGRVTNRALTNRALTRATLTPTRRPHETGGASDTW